MSIHVGVKYETLNMCLMSSGNLLTLLVWETILILEHHFVLSSKAK